MGKKNLGFAIGKFVFKSVVIGNCLLKECFKKFLMVLKTQYLITKEQFEKKKLIN